MRALTAFVVLVGCGGTVDVDHDAATSVDAAGRDAPVVPRDSGPPVEGCASIPTGQWQEITPPSLDRPSWCTPDFNPSGCGNPGDMRPGHVATYGAQVAN